MSFPSPFYRWRPHPWHGLEIGPNPPEILNAYIEISSYEKVLTDAKKRNRAFFDRLQIQGR